MIKCFHGYTTVKGSFTLILYLDMKKLKGSKVGNSMLYVIINQ